VTDTWDRRTIVIILQSIMNKKSTKDGFKLDFEGNYTIPDCKGKLNQFLEAVNALDEEFEGPEL